LVHRVTALPPEFEAQSFYAVASMPPANFTEEDASRAAQANSAAADGQ
jgi:hypothetical protein